MDKLIKKVEYLGWYTGHLDINIRINRAFEGFSGKASEDWETQYEFHSNEVKNSAGDVIFPKIDEKSKPFERFEDFIKKIEAKL